VRSDHFDSMTPAIDATEVAYLVRVIVRAEDAAP
jgi:hypothetical protein